MPNFVAKDIKLPNLPFCANDVTFKCLATGRKCDLVEVVCQDEPFFLIIKKSSDGYVIKGEKSSKPTKIGLLQKTLEVFKDNFCKEIVSQSFAFKKKSLIQKETPIKTQDEIIDLIRDNLDKNIYLEIGFGSGRHLLYRAKESKDKKEDSIFIGIEIYKPALEQVAKLALSKEIDNLYLINADARILFELIPDNCIEKIFCHFPVPWDDAPHRRVISDEFLKATQRVLKVNSKFELRSDSFLYTSYSIERMLNLNGVEIKIEKNKDLKVSSKYEDRWRKQNKDIFDVYMTNDIKSHDLENKYDMSFDRNFDIGKLAKNFSHKTFKFDDYFLNMQEIYEVRNVSNELEMLILKVSMGAFYKPENKFIMIKKDEAKYFQSPPYNTQLNFKAHKKIKDILEQWQK